MSPPRLTVAFAMFVQHFEVDAFLKCETMGALLRENLRQARRADRVR